MVLPLQVTFRNLDRSERIEEKIWEEAGKLEKFYGRIMSCRVVVEAPERHHQHGNMHHVRIDLGVPGTELVINGEPNLHSSISQAGGDRVTKQLQVQVPHMDVDVAIHDAFRAARRKLQDYAQRQRGEVKLHEILQEQV